MWIRHFFSLEFPVQQRYVVVAMMFLSLMMTFSLRMSFPIVLTQMVAVPNSSPNTDKNNATNNEIICPVKHHMIENVSDVESIIRIPVDWTTLLCHYLSRLFISLANVEIDLFSKLNNSNRYNWSQQLQGMILSSFYWGGIFAEIPGSILVQKKGPKTILLISIALSAIVTAITPLAVRYGCWKMFEIANEQSQINECISGDEPPFFAIS